MGNNKKHSVWQKLKEFFTISDKDLRDWKKKNYESRRKIGTGYPYYPFLSALHSLSSVKN